MSSNVQDAIMMLGDSLTQGGWEAHAIGQRLAYVYTRKLDIINRGLSGYNTEWAIPIFEQCFAMQHEQQHVQKVVLLTIWFGANDACLKPSPQHVPIAKFINNLRYLLNMVSAPTSPYYSPSTHVILITPPPVNTYQRRADLASRTPPLELDRDFNVTKSYAEAVKGVGSEANIPTVDLWSTLWDLAGHDEQALSKYLWDGLHLNSAGYGVLYDLFMKVISEKLPQLHYENIEPVFPPWAQIKNEGPRKTKDASTRYART